MGNPFNKYDTQEADHYIEAMDATITLRELTYAEAEEFMQKAIKGEDENGEPIIDLDAITAAMLEKISLTLVNPKMTVEQLSKLSISARGAFLEITKIIEGLGNVDAGGKSDSPTETSST